MRTTPRWRAGLGALAALCLLASIGPAVARPGGLLPDVGDAVEKASEPLVWGDFAPAFPGDIVVSQPDGSKFKALLTGGEIGGTLEVDGYTVTKRADGWWVFAAGREGRSLLETVARVGLDQRPTDLALGVGRVANVWSDGKGGDLRTQALRQLQMASYQAAEQARAAGAPRVFKFPVIMLATWWDEEAGQTSPQFQEGNTPEAFKELLDGFGGNDTGTLTEFYFENSFGQFLVQVDVFGPYASPRSVEDRCYYGGIDPSTDPIDDLDPLDNALPGGGGAVGMAVEGVPQADVDIDFSEYDNDGDGFVDFTAMLHSGPDMAATGDPCHTWSHAIEAGLAGPIVEEAAGLEPGTLGHGIPTSDGVLVNRLFTMPEIDLEIGVAVHEMAHALGEPDYYNPDYTSMGTGDWDIMAGGSWFGNPPGSNPTGFNPASKIFQGWITPKLVKDDVKDLVLQPRNLLPSPGYAADQVDPNIVLVPTKSIAVGETDEMGHTWDETDVYGLTKDGDRYVIEGYFLENWSRSILAPAFDPKMPRSSMFDRQALASGLMVWHFDYYLRSNVYYGANDAGTDPNRPQMDPVEWDYNDNSQELQLGMTRGEPQDLVAAAATGITSGTRAPRPGVPVVQGEPQDDVAFTGSVPPTATSSHDFTVEANPASYRMRASVVGTGDCKLRLLHDGEPVGDEADDGFVGDEELIEVVQPEPGPWTLEVADYLACGDYEAAVTFSKSEGVFDTRGAGDTWSNWTEKPTGWAFTNVRPVEGEGVDTILDAGQGTITLDVLRLDAGDTDVSPGFVSPFDLDAGAVNKMTVPVFNNGGTNQPKVGVTVRRGSTVIASGSVAVGPYSRATFAFDHKPSSEGTQALTVTVDPAGAISEVSEGNNAQRSIIEVSPSGGRVLVVDDDGAGDAQDSVTGPLSVLGITFDVVRPPVTAEHMKRYQAVVWEAGLERYQGQLSVEDRAAIAAYLDGGGRLLYMSPRAASAIGEPAGSTNPLQSEDAPAFLADYFGATWIDTQQVGGGRVTGTGDILGTDAFDMTVMAGRPLQDVFGAAESAVGSVVPVATWEKGGDDSLMGVRVQGDAEHGGFRSVFFGFNPSQVLSADATVSIIERSLGHLGVAPASYPAPRMVVLRHTSVRQSVPGTDVQIIVFTKGGSVTPTLTYRRHGGPTVTSVKMTRGRLAGTWQATIPGSIVTTDGVDYVIDAGTARSPFTNPIPHYISVGYKK
jgi:M6 family metalloprotease-like protein